MSLKPRVWPVFVTFVVASLAMVIAAAVVFAVRMGLTGSANPPPLDAGMLLVTVLLTELVLLTAALAAARPFTLERFGLGGKVPPVRAFVVATLGILALGTILETVALLLGLSRTGSIPQMKRAMEGASGMPLVAMVLAVGPLAGLAEELFFRGFMQVRLQERWRPAVAVLLTSLCFGLLHLDVVHAPEAFFLGLWLGFTTVRNGSLLPAIAAHVLNNTTAVLLQASGLASSAVAPNLIQAAVALVVFALCLRFTPATKALVAAPELISATGS